MPSAWTQVSRQQVHSKQEMKAREKAERVPPATLKVKGLTTRAQFGNFRNFCGVILSAGAPSVGKGAVPSSWGGLVGDDHSPGCCSQFLRLSERLGTSGVTQLCVQEGEGSRPLPSGSQSWPLEVPSSQTHTAKSGSHKQRVGHRGQEPVGSPPLSLPQERGQGSPAPHLG